VMPSTVADLETKLTGILAKLDALPLETIGADLTKTLDNADGLLKDASKTLERVDTGLTPELTATLAELRGLIASANGLLETRLGKTLDEANTTLAEVTRAVQELRGPLATADRVLKNTDATLLGKDAPVQQDLRDALREVGRAARSLRELMDFLERHPEALIRGKTQENP
jgi:paraquat-inducible protein B